MISGTGSLTWNGLGTGILSALNTYTGGTVVNKGTLQLTNGSLGSNNVTVASGATLAVQGGVFKFDLSNSADRLVVQGNFTISGTSNIRLNTGSLTSISPGTYPLISAAGSASLGAFQIDGGTTVTVPAQSLIKQLGGTPVANVTGGASGNVGGTFYRFTLQSAANAEQVVVTPAPTRVVTIMPLGASITEGISADPTTTGGGYRSQMYQMFVDDGRFSPNFVGSRNVLGGVEPRRPPQRRAERREPGVQRRTFRLHHDPDSDQSQRQPGHGEQRRRLLARARQRCQPGLRHGQRRRK